MQVRKVAEENGVDVSEQIKELEQRARQVRDLSPFCCFLFMVRVSLGDR